MIASAVSPGFAASLALIVAIGAQNAFVLRQGCAASTSCAIVVTCAASDALLITAGIAGLGAAIAPRTVCVADRVRWCGAAFLLGYAVLAPAGRAARRAGPADRPPATLRATVLTCLAFTYLNPHVYLDTVLLLGAVASQHEYRGCSVGRGAGQRRLVHGARRRRPPARPAARPAGRLAGAGPVIGALMT